MALTYSTSCAYNFLSLRMGFVGWGGGEGVLPDPKLSLEILPNENTYIHFIEDTFG